MAVDVNTTGHSPVRDRSVQPGPGEVAWEWETLLHPGRLIGSAASAIHGIFNADVADAPAFGDRIEAIERRLRKRSIFATSDQ